MSDKEPRRRKKRKDQLKKDEVQFEDTSFVTQKQEPKDSDQETEDDHFVATHHQPSKIAKVVFLLLFSALAVTMGIVFIALRGAERGPVDIFEVEHHEPILEVEEGGHDEDTEMWNISDLFGGTKDSIEAEISEPPDLSEQLDGEELHVANENQEELNLETASEVYEEQFHSTHNWHEDLDQDSLHDDVENNSESEPIDYIEREIIKERRHEEPVEHKYVYTPEVEESALEMQPPTIDEVDDEPQKDERKIPSETYSNDDQDPRVYEKYDITNEEDFNIREEIDGIDNILDKSPDKALLKYENLLRLYPHSPRALYGKSQALDKLAESQRSNSFLEQAIASYQAVMDLEKVPDKIYRLSGNRVVDRMRFRGFVGKSLKLQVKMMERFPNDVEIMKHLAVGYLLIGQNKEAKKLFLSVLEQKPEDGFSKVHLGFILKTDEKNYSEAIKLMADGIASKEVGVLDGRFFLHLGDALSRTGNQSEAMKVYEDGAKEGLFLSAYQRSLYNVNGLTSKPWWNPSMTVYSKFIQSGFTAESEGLQDTGDWKQFELFMRGKKHPRNCDRVPLTCSLVSQMPDASGCKRGQVKFSIMQPGTHVWAHCGPTNCRLRSHLGLVVPEGAKIRVANETKEWMEGKVIMFDDSFEHEVWHEGKSLRLVLIVDFWHPELTAYQKSSLSPI